MDAELRYYAPYVTDYNTHFSISKDYTTPPPHQLKLAQEN